MLQMKFLLILWLEPHPPSVLSFANRFSPAAHVADPVGVHREHLVLSPLGSVLLNGRHVELEDLFVDLVDFVDHVGFLVRYLGNLGWEGSLKLQNLGGYMRVEMVREFGTV